MRFSSGLQYGHKEDDRRTGGKSLKGILKSKPEMNIAIILKLRQAVGLSPMIVEEDKELLQVIASSPI